jgi:hypothetical protein
VSEGGSVFVWGTRKARDASRGEGDGRPGQLPLVGSEIRRAGGVGLAVHVHASFGDDHAAVDGVGGRGGQVEVALSRAEEVGLGRVLQVVIACGASRLGRLRSIAGGFGDPSRVPISIELKKPVPVHDTIGQLLFNGVGVGEDVRMPVSVLVVSVIVLALVLVGIVFLLGRYYVRVPVGHALVVHTGSGMKVSFSGRLVLPVVHRHELLDIRAQCIPIERKGGEGLLCADLVRLDASIRFFVRVPADEEAVRRVVSTLGAARASHPKALRELFHPRFVESLKTVLHELESNEVAGKRDEIRRRVIEHAGKDLNGFLLDDVQIDA